MEQQQSGITPLEELNRLDAEFGSVTDLSDLRPIFYRLEEIERENRGDFEVQLQVADLRRRLVERGVQLGARSRANCTAAARDARESVPERWGWRRLIYVGILVGLLGSLGLWVTMVQIARERNPDLAPVSTSSTAIPVNITTTPPGATIQINNETKCTSNCKISLSPGNYQVTALMDGFDPVATGVTVVPGAPVNVNLNLSAQAQAVRVLTDLPSGSVSLDDQPAGQLQEGQLILDRVPNGAHTMQITGGGGTARFAFELVGGKPPVITGPITSRDVTAVLVSSLGNEASVQTNSPQKITLDAQPQGETTDSGLQLKNVTPGNHDLMIGEGKDAKKMVVTFGAAPMLTAFVKSDVNAGTLVVATGEDGVSVFVNGKEQKRRTDRGQLRVMTLGDVTVRVAKEGFQPLLERSAKINKGEETRLEFKLIPLPQVASLQVRGASPGTSVHLGDRILGTIGADGSLSVANLPPGEHVLELRRQGFANKKFTRTFRAGETVLLTGAELAMVPTTALVHLALSPPDAAVTWRHSDESQTHAVREPSFKLEAGSYVFSIKAPGYEDRTERVQVAAGETRTLEFRLTKAAVTVTQTKPLPASSPIDWSKTGWDFEDGAWVKKGGSFVVVRSGPVNGTVTFTAELKKGGGFLRGAGKIRWFLDYTDSKNYALFELDKKNFTIKEIREGRSLDRGKRSQPGGDLRSVEIQVEVSGDRVTNRMKVGQQWMTLDSWTVPGHDFTDGKFGFFVPGSDEIGITNFHYSPR